jgi:hypothetical protein
MSALIIASQLCGCAGSGEKKAAATTPAMSFSNAERDLILAYYGRKANPPAGPATAKIGTRIEPGSRPQHLPSDLHSQLKVLPEPYTWYVLGTDVVLVNRNTHEILDVVPGVAY